jgi:hypothetical protein
MKLTSAACPYEVKQGCRDHVENNENSKLIDGRHQRTCSIALKQRKANPDHKILS